ncbi:MAG TPA: AMP-binding protein [Thermoleophilaceae bacterium]|nr:AMP-binding protein [Thermoleophilaceae bacterium]
MSDAPVAVRAVRVLGRAGVLRPVDPLTGLRMGGALRRWGKGLAGVVAAAAARDGDRISLIDELGPVTAAELHERSSALALALAERGVGPGDGLGLLCRDHRFFAEAAVAAGKLGADLLLLNTSFSGPQLQDVLQREGARVLVHDAEFDGLVEPTPGSVLRVLAWQDEPDPGRPSIDSVIAAAPAGHPDPPAEPGRTVLLTSGTTGTPKGARRPPEAPTSALVSVLERIPLRRGDRHFVAAPLFHAWGFAHFGLGLLLGCEVVLRRRFDAEQTLATIARQRVTSVAMVPVMGQRMLALPDEVRARYDCSRLRLIALGGSAIPGDLAVRLMDEYGDVVHNAYGSSEVAIVSIAGPADLRADPATAGRPVTGIELRLLDADGREVPAGRPGRIFVGSEAAFEGYTGGQTKESLDGLMSSGDLGSLDPEGRLRIEGRDDDMIVSGGENVYPREVEDVIGSLDGVLEAAVVGVDDEDFGQRLKAFVVPDGDGAPDADAVKQVVRDRLARYKVPRDVEFLDELPRNATGKVLKRELR